MFWCNVIISIICLFVCIATSKSEVTKNLMPNFWVNIWTTGYRKHKASCALDYFSLPNNVPVNHSDMPKLIWWDPIDFSSIVYPAPCIQNVTEPPKILGPPKDILVLRTSYSHLGALNGSTGPITCISITSPKRAYLITQTLHTIRVKRKGLHNRVLSA
jgi:hypothetical protein